MYAVVSTGGKQYRVEPGSTLTIERLAVEAGATLTFDRVLLIGDGDAVTVGTPIVTGASVSATVLGEELGPKLVIFKFKQKVKYRRRTGHRQHLMRIRIDAINADGQARAKPKPKAEPKAEVQPKTDDTAEAEGTAAAKAAPKPARARTSRAKPGAKATAESPDASAETPVARAKPVRRATPARRVAKPKAQE